MGRKKKFADGTWPEGMKKEVELCLEHMDITKSVHARVAAAAGPVSRSELKNELERKIALRLATLGYFKADTLFKNVEDRAFRIAPHKPARNPLNL